VRLNNVERSVCATQFQYSSYVQVVTVMSLKYGFTASLLLQECMLEDRICIGKQNVGN